VHARIRPQQMWYRTSNPIKISAA